MGSCKQTRAQTCRRLADNVEVHVLRRVCSYGYMGLHKGCSGMSELWGTVSMYISLITKASEWGKNGSQNPVWGKGRGRVFSLFRFLLCYVDLLIITVPFIKIIYFFSFFFLLSRSLDMVVHKSQVTETDDLRNDGACLFFVKLHSVVCWKPSSHTSSHPHFYS